MDSCTDNSHSIVTCTKKRRYVTADYADKVARSMQTMHPGPWEFRAYYCGMCLCYHVGRRYYDDSEQYFYSPEFTMPLRDQEPLKHEQARMRSGARRHYDRMGRDGEDDY